MFPKYSPLYHVWKWIALRTFPNDEDNKPSIDINSGEDIFNIHSQERLNGVIGVLFNEARMHFVHSSELIPNASKYL